MTTPKFTFLATYCKQNKREIRMLVKKTSKNQITLPKVVFDTNVLVSALLFKGIFKNTCLTRSNKKV